MISLPVLNSEDFPTNSGVFLREITSRLTNGLAAEIPDLQERVNHILTKQNQLSGKAVEIEPKSRRSRLWQDEADFRNYAAKLDEPALRRA